MKAIALEADADLVVRRELPLGQCQDPDRSFSPLTMPCPVGGEGRTRREKSIDHLLMAQTLDRLDSGDGVCLTRIDQVKVMRPHAEQDLIWRVVGG